MALVDTLARIDELKAEIDALRPIDAETEARIMQKFRLDWNYHSNNIEGNSLTFGETKTFLLHGITAQGKPLKDHLDIKGHNEAILLLDDVVKGERPLTESFLREMHKLILHEPYTRKAKTADGIPTVKHITIGQYKQTPNHVETATGEIFYFATPEETPAQMNDLMDWYTETTTKKLQHPLIIAAEFHYRFIRIHPFDDGNGRMARIIMNLILMKFGYPPVVIKTTEKQAYYNALRTADGGDIVFFVNYIGEQLINSLQLYLRGAIGESIEELSDVDKEIALLKAELNETDNKIIYSGKTSNLIAEQSVNSLIGMVFAKLSQFEDLFDESDIYIWLNNGVASLHTKDEVKSVIGNLMNKSAQLEEIQIAYNFRGFLKTEKEVFDIGTSFTLSLKSVYFFVIVKNGEQQTFKIFYHQKNAQSKFEEIANLLAKQVLAQIKTKLAE